MPRPDYIKCIFDERATNVANRIHDNREPELRTDVPNGPNHLSWCGVQLDGWHFQSVDHALNTIRHGSHLLPCPECVSSIRKTLDER